VTYWLLVVTYGYESGDFSPEIFSRMIFSNSSGISGHSTRFSNCLVLSQKLFFICCKKPVEMEPEPPCVFGRVIRKVFCPFSIYQYTAWGARLLGEPDGSRDNFVITLEKSFAVRLPQFIISIFLNEYLQSFTPRLGQSPQFSLGSFN
jgi:hypothetical protein